MDRPVKKTKRHKFKHSFYLSYKIDIIQAVIAFLIAVTTFFTGYSIINQATFFEIETRPWAAIELLDNVTATRDSIYIKANLSNPGNTPALRFRHTALFNTTKQFPADSLKMKINNIREINYGIIFPNQKLKWNFPVGFNIVVKYEQKGLEFERELSPERLQQYFSQHEKQNKYLYLHLYIIYESEHKTYYIQLTKKMDFYHITKDGIKVDWVSEYSSTEPI